MDLIRLFIDRPVMTLMMVLVFVVLGLVSYRRINVDLFPEVDLPIVLVTQVYEGAGPEEIETQIVREVEDAVSTISDIRHITSTIYEGYALTVIEFEYGVDVDIKSIEVKDKVDAIARDLPQEAERPVIEKLDPFDEPVLSIALFSDTMPIHEIYRYADDVLKDRFSRVGGVASVEVVGGRERQINVRADLPRLLSSGVSLSALANAIQEQNLDIPAGAMDRGEFEIGVRLKGQFESIEEIEDMHLAVKDRSVVRVRDVARVEDGFEDPESAARFNGREAVMIEIFKQTDSNVVSTADGVYSVLESVKQTLPKGLEAEISRDGTDFIRESISGALNSIFIGVGLTALVLLLFLGDLRMAMVAALVIPASLISTFLSWSPWALRSTSSPSWPWAFPSAPWWQTRSSSSRASTVISI
jgi:HAE1 family hydrophobic/amphiphilic exporter-1